MSDTNRRDIVEVLMNACCDFLMKGTGYLDPRELQAAASEILALREKGRWIPAAERLPDNGQWCWVWWEGLSDPFTAMRDKRAVGGWRDSFAWEDFYKKVTHWMLREPTPEPPTAETPLSGRAAAEDDVFTARIRAGGDDAVAAMHEYMEIRSRLIHGIVDAFGLRRWIPVAERLPARNVSVLVWIPTENEKTFIASLDEGGMWFSSDPAADGYSLGEHGSPSHWMPLPTPPSGGNP